MSAVMTNTWVEFPSTRHSLLRGAQDGGRTCQRAAIDHLCQRYRQPVYSFIRRAWSRTAEDAQDLTQAFFLHLIEQDVLSKYDPARGGFRKFLKSVLRHVVADIRDAERAQKRGGGVRRISIEDHDEGSLAQCIEDPRAQNPETAFDATWRREMLGRAMERARHWFASRGRPEKFQAFEILINGGADRPTYADVAGRLGLKESDVRNALFEVRERIRVEARAELAQTVGDSDQLDEEYRELIGE
jgi:RNA polymerase sigma-70 factor (ECF subfamily)